MAVLLRIILIAIAIQMTYGRLGFQGQCPAVTVPSNFDVARYLGTWFVQSKYPGPQSANRRCDFSTYGLDTARNLVTVTNGAINTATGQLFTNPGVVNIVGPAQWEVILNNRPITNVANYNILGTNYLNYAVVYDCTNVNATFHTKAAFILTRGRFPGANVITTAQNILVANGVDTTLLQTVDQTNCLVNG